MPIHRWEAQAVHKEFEVYKAHKGQLVREVYKDHRD
jgi:hypothetical protein